MFEVLVLGMLNVCYLVQVTRYLKGYKWDRYDYNHDTCHEQTAVRDNIYIHKDSFKFIPGGMSVWCTALQVIPVWAHIIYKSDIYLLLYPLHYIYLTGIGLSHLNFWHGLITTAAKKV